MVLNTSKVHFKNSNFFLSTNNSNFSLLGISTLLNAFIYQLRWIISEFMILTRPSKSYFVIQKPSILPAGEFQNPKWATRRYNMRFPGVSLKCMCWVIHEVR